MKIFNGALEKIVAQRETRSNQNRILIVLVTRNRFISRHTFGPGLQNTIEIQGSNSIVQDEFHQNP